jgi:hypothetical protein
MDSYTVVFRIAELQQRLWTRGPSAPPIPLEECGDLTDLEFYANCDAISNLYGNKLVTVKLGCRKNGTFRHVIQMANYRFRSATADTAHPWPLASRRVPPTASPNLGPITTSSTTSLAASLTPARDWGHDASPVHTKVFHREGTSEWASTRIARPGAACDLICRGNCVQVLLDSERAILTISNDRWVEEQVGGVHTSRLPKRVSR